MFYHGKIDTSLFTDDFKTVSYIKESFNCPDTVEMWQERYGKIYNTGELADHRVSLPIWVNDVAKQFNLSNTATALYRMIPGNILPYHQDTYKNYINYFKITKPERIWRAVVFLESWKPGHIFEVDGTAFTNYSAGTFVIWNYQTSHMAGNIGFDDRYTLQVTGISDV